MLGGSKSCQERKRASRSDRDALEATVAPVRRNGKELEREAQADTDGAARLKPVWMAVLAVHRQWTSPIREGGIHQGCSVILMKGSRVEGRAIDNPEAARSDEVLCRVAVDLLPYRSHGSLVQEVGESSREAQDF